MNTPVSFRRAFLLACAGLVAFGCAKKGGALDAGDSACKYGGNSYRAGEAFPALDGCNTCSCQDGTALCTLRICDAGVLSADLASPGGASCAYGGKSYRPEEEFPALDGCNTCTCTEGQALCSLRMCDAGVLPVDAAPAGKPDVPAPVADGPRPISDGPLPAADGPAVIVDSRQASKDAPAPPDAPPADVQSTNDVAVDAPVICRIGTTELELGQSTFDGCNTCQCTARGIACTARYCPPPDAGSCTIPTILTFGPTGGMVIYQDSSSLIPPFTYTHQRTYLRTDASTSMCFASLPACGSADGALVTNVLADLSNADVQSAFGLAQTPVFGVDMRPVDGTIFSVARDGHTILVGGPCSSPVASSCRPVPAGVQRLVDDLRALDNRMVPQCPPFSN